MTETPHAAVNPVVPTDAELDLAREEAAEALTRAHAAVNHWATLVRNGAAERVGSACNAQVATDAAYDLALDAFSPLNRAVVAWHDVAEQITAGGLR